MSVTPNVTYSSITINGTPISLSSTARASFVAPFNRIDITYRSDVSLIYYEVRVTKVGDEWDIGVGTKPYSFSGSISANTDHSYSIPINSTYFNQGDGAYRISLYAKSYDETTWDVTYIFMVLNEPRTQSLDFIDSNNQGVEVLTKREPPEA